MAIGVRSKYNSGDIDGANKKSASAKKWLLITVAVAVMASLYDGFRIISSNSNFFQEIQNGNFGFLYWIK